jgi:hypothetical protein
MFFIYSAFKRRMRDVEGLVSILHRDQSEAQPAAARSEGTRPKHPKSVSSTLYTTVVYSIKFSIYS